MTRTPRPAVATLLLVASACVAGLAAQANPVFKARLAPVPIDANTQAKTTGSGAVTATLKGTTLSVTGTFNGLQGAATIAQVHVGPRGIHGPAVLDLTVTKGTSGTIQGELTLTAAQVDHLRRNRLYVQIHSEAAPDGNLWGWLIP